MIAKSHTESSNSDDDSNTDSESDTESDHENNEDIEQMAALLGKSEEQRLKTFRVSEMLKIQYTSATGRFQCIGID
ncbi:hypothetical protein AgCh_004188 [Apium graveolens]